MPRASKEDQDRLATLGPDCSLLLTHLIRQNGNPSKSDSQARDTLKSILALGRKRKPVLEGSSTVGWFGTCDDANCFDPSCGDLAKVPVDLSVCFTESTLAGLRGHRDVFKAKYGLAFDREYLYGRGANPCLNIREEILKKGVRWHKSYPRKLFNFIPQHLRPFVNVINRAFDATHEREWRYVGNLEFAHSDVRLVFCPEADFAVFSKIQKEGKPILFDLEWLDRF